jgi:DNA-binding MarR family transcriptional regulator
VTSYHKPLAGRSFLEPADVLRMVLPSFWWTPQGSELRFRGIRAQVSLMAFEGLGLQTHRKLAEKTIRVEKRRMKVKKYDDEWWIPMTKASAYLVANFKGKRPENSGPLLFVDENGLALQLAQLAYPFMRADDLLGADLPLTTMLAEFFASNTGKHSELNAILAFRNKRWPGQDGPPEASMWEMVGMLDGTDPLKGDTRVFDNEAYAEDKIRALGNSDLPKSLWDLTKHRNVGRQFKQRLPEDDPLVIKIREGMSCMPTKQREMMTERTKLFEETMPQINPLIVEGRMAAEQAARLFGLTNKGFDAKRAWWRKGGDAARKAANADKPKKSQAKKRPPLKRDEKNALKALKNAAWPFIDEKIAEYRQKLVDLHFTTVANIIHDRNLKGYEAAKLFRTKGTVISDLLADAEAGSPLVVMTTTDPEERQKAKAAVETAIAERREGQTFANIARQVRNATGLRISSEFVRGINELAKKKAKAAGEPKRRRKARNLRQEGLTPAAVTALWSLDRQRGKALGTLATEWGCDPTNASHVVAELVQNGYAVRPRDPRDGRCRSVTLTDAGVAIKQKIVAS